MNAEKPYLTEDEFCREFSMSRTKSWRLRKSGKGPHYIMLGGTICYPQAEIRRWVDDGLQTRGDRIRQLFPFGKMIEERK